MNGLVNGSSPNFSLSAVAAVLMDFGSTTCMVKNTAVKSDFLQTEVRYSEIKREHI